MRRLQPPLPAFTRFGKYLAAITAVTALIYWVQHAAKPAMIQLAIVLTYLTILWHHTTSSVDHRRSYFLQNRVFADADHSTLHHHQVPISGALLLSGTHKSHSCCVQPQMTI